MAGLSPHVELANSGGGIERELEICVEYRSRGPEREARGVPV